MKKTKLNIFLILGVVMMTGCQTLQPVQQIPSQEILATDISFNVETGEIKYTLPEPALVRIRIGIQEGGALLRHLVDWQQRAAGEHVELWDGKDSSGLVDFQNRTDLMLVLACLPVDATEREKYSGIVQGYRESPTFDISFPEAQNNSDGLITVSGVTPLRVTINPEDQKWLTETKFEMGIFIDQVFLTEDEEGTNPYTYLLNTKGLNDGPHVITVNIIGYQGEVGTKSVRIYVKNKMDKVK